MRRVTYKSQLETLMQSGASVSTGQDTCRKMVEKYTGAPYLIGHGCIAKCNGYVGEIVPNISRVLILGHIERSSKANEREVILLSVKTAQAKIVENFSRLNPHLKESTEHKASVRGAANTQFSQSKLLPCRE